MQIDTVSLTDLPALEQSTVMLDFDGTLVDLAPTPQAIKVPDTLSTLLNKIDDRSAGLTIITGRALDDLARILPEFGGDIFGSHGGEQRLGGVYELACAVPQAQLEQVWGLADKIAAKSQALIAERKPAGAVVHYRQDPTQEDMVRDALAAVTRDTTDFEIQASKMAFEIRPVGVSKAAAAEWVIAASPRGTIPVFAGDDLTDEDAMRVANAHNGVTIKVGAGESCARHRISRPSALRQTLRAWLEATS